MPRTKLVDGQEVEFTAAEEIARDAEEATEAGNQTEVISRIKAEAHRRIILIIPEWKQRNLTAQAAVLAEKGRANWTAEELAAWDAGEAVWAQVQAVRTASDALEAIDPIPTDITADQYWP